MPNNNDWKELERPGNKEFLPYEGVMYVDYETVKKYVSQNFISISSLEKFIEENRKGDINPDTGLPYYSSYWKGERDGHNSVLNLLDNFIHKES